jgi:hypothetical protein
MFWPLAACLLLPGLLGDHGLHIIRREINPRSRNVEP